MFQHPFYIKNGLLQEYRLLELGGQSNLILKIWINILKAKNINRIRDDKSSITYITEWVNVSGSIPIDATIIWK